MSGYRLIFELSKGPLFLLALCLVLVIALVGGLIHYRGQTEVTLAQVETELQATRTEIQALTYDLVSLEKHFTNFRHLSHIGLIGEPGREDWVQNLVAIYNELELPPTLSYALSPPLPFAGSFALVGGAQSSPPSVLLHDLDIELYAIHEGEFLSFMERLRSDWQTPFRVEKCLITRDLKPGLRIKCTLRLFSMPLKANGKPAGA
ncbi:MAG: hypothetical protein PHI06_08595 [Desulfobulbaceae bacterium]|nr:hypothetical protein [Desulfobulbaceae bacterium]